MTPPSPDTPNETGPKGTIGAAEQGDRANSAEANHRQWVSRARQARGNETQTTGTQDIPQVDHPETIGSLIKRLGTPPSEMADRLAEKFRSACQDALSRGQAIRDVKLDQWAIGDRGNLVFLGHPQHDPDSNPEQAPLDAAELTSHFRRLVSSPRAARGWVKKPPIKPIRRPIVDDPIVDDLIVDDANTSSLSVDEQKRREALIQQFAASLADRFGVEAISEADSSVIERPAPIRLKPLERDRRFNWNLLFYVGTVAAVITMVVTGALLSRNRQKRAELAILNRAASRSGEVKAVISPGISSVPEEQSFPEPVPIDLDKRPEIDQSKIKSLRTATERSLGSNRDAVIFDVMEELKAELAQQNATDAAQRSDDPNAPAASRNADSSLSEAQTPIDLSAQMNLGDAIEKEALGEIIGSRTDPAKSDASLESALNAGDRDPNTPQNPQKTRPSESRFVELPFASNTELETSLGPASVSIGRIEFPMEVPVSLSNPDAAGARRFINDQNGVTLAHLISKSESTYFRWANNAVNDKLAGSIVHGRLVDEDGASIYLRPSIESDSFALTLDSRRLRPTWKLGARILPEPTRLELDLLVPDSIDLAWPRVFNAARPNRGTGTAILTPKDGETVAIAVKLTVDCSRNLTCRLQYAGRLDPTLPWQLLSEQSFATQSAMINTAREALALKKHQFELRYKAASSIDRPLMKPQREEFEKAEQRLELTASRMQMLGRLAIEMEEQVKLKLHLYVQWPDARQTIFRTVVENDVK